MPDAVVLAIVAVLVVVVIGLSIAAAVIRGRIVGFFLRRVRRDLEQLDVVRQVTGDSKAPPRNFRESLFDAMSGKEPRQPAAWRRGSRKQPENWPEASSSKKDGPQP